MKNCVILLILLFFGASAMAQEESKNIFGNNLSRHGDDNMPTGFYRDGYCNTGANDAGSHVIAATVTDEFLEYTKSQGNDLQTPRPEYNFAGLKAGDKWCLCAVRWKQAEQAGVAPPVDLKATHANALKIIPLETLKKYDVSNKK